MNSTKRWKLHVGDVVWGLSGDLSFPNDILIYKFIFGVDCIVNTKLNYFRTKKSAEKARRGIYKLLKRKS